MAWCQLTREAAGKGEMDKKTKWPGGEFSTGMPRFNKANTDYVEKMNMTKATHTPGPWTTEKVVNSRLGAGSTTDRRLWVIRSKQRPFDIGEVYLTASQDEKEQAANARLIAAAPALFEALKIADEWINCPYRPTFNEKHGLDPETTLHETSEWVKQQLRLALRAAEGGE